MFLIIILYLILALTFVFAKDAVTVCSPIFFVAIRMILAGMLLLLPEIIKTKKISLIKKSDIPLFIIITFLHIYIPFIGEFWALQYTDALKVNFLFALTPFFAIILEAIFYKKIPSIRTIIGTIIGFCALFSILNVHASGAIGSFSSLFYLTFPEIILLISIISGTAAWFFIKKLVQRSYVISMVNGTSMLFGGILSLCTAFSFETILITDSFAFIKELVLLILFSNIIFYNLYGKLLERYSLAFLTACGFLAPLFGMIIESIVQLKLPNPIYYFSLFAVFVGLLLIAKDEKVPIQ